MAAILAYPAPDNVRSVAIVGAGLIGASWAAYFLSRGIVVRATDPAPGAEARLRAFIDSAWTALERLGLPPGADRSKFAFCEAIEETVQGVDFVQENAREDEALKIELFHRIGDATPRGTIVASSSSALLMSRIQSRCRYPERCVLGHPFNPPHLVPLVEVVGGDRTDPAAVDAAVAFYNRIGKRAVRLNREIGGHIANRLAAALWREAIHLVATGVASVEDVDASIAYGPGLRWAIMGPYLTYHMGGGTGGLESFFAQFGRMQEERWADLGRPKMTPELQRTLIEGVRDATGGKSMDELAAERDRCLIAVLAALKACRAQTN
ncbi:MAG TPA: 3-hydroxyacyl-CoA dehydrogenase NAD-binding domain-containing protein [Alphaproteobacteria bacterium]|nr:3-hydroxyacyl-CoA dehydrogenase NAD-binding domain-containing protein [Alphaproteobacteria bacterium]